MTKFSANIYSIFKACSYPVMLPWQQNICQLKYQNTEVYLLILCLANFGDAGINGFGKIKNAAQVLKTVFSHLNSSFTALFLHRMFLALL